VIHSVTVDIQPLHRRRHGEGLETSDIAGGNVTPIER